jgi:hypothetical protein
MERRVRGRNRCGRVRRYCVFLDQVEREGILRLHIRKGRLLDYDEIKISGGDQRGRQDETELTISAAVRVRLHHTSHSIRDAVLAERCNPFLAIHREKRPQRFPQLAAIFAAPADVDGRKCVLDATTHDGEVRVVRPKRVPFAHPASEDRQCDRPDVDLRRWGSSVSVKLKAWRGVMKHA